MKKLYTFALFLTLSGHVSFGMDHQKPNNNCFSFIRCAIEAGKAVDDHLVTIIQLALGNTAEDGTQGTETKSKDAR